MACSSREIQELEFEVRAAGAIDCPNRDIQTLEVEGSSDTHKSVVQTEADPSTINLVQNSPLLGKSIVPYEGMEFDSIDSAKEFYDKYATSNGFRMRISKKIKSRKDGTVIAQELVCWKEGFREEKYKQRADRILPIPDETRTGCKAIFVVSKRGECKWVVSRLVLDHNHEFTSPKSMKFMRKRKRSKAQLNLIDVLDKSGVKPSKIMSVLATEAGGIDRVCLNESSVRNYLSNKRQKNMEKGDAQLMLTYFREQQSKNPGFFYAIQVDSEGHLANCFWVDARSRMAYKRFGDVVTFDPTYLTNKYRMPFVPFTGVNHHCQSVLFGCALLWDETEETFVWLLQTWLKAMFGKMPSTIITDQDHAITNAIRRVFPTSVAHHFCMWHILKKVPEALGNLFQKYEEFKLHFHKCIHQSITPDEFESAWAELIKTYNLENNDWLTRIYSVREKWIPAYLRQNFCAGMSTTQRSESMNSFFKDYVNSSTSMSTFVLQYEKALDARFDKEKEKNFKTINSRPIFKTKYPMEGEAAQSYTRKKFRLFQEELFESQQYVSEKIDAIDGVYNYKVHEFNKSKPVYIVNLKMESVDVVCTCHKFELEGILCRHILMVLIKKKILSLPPRYILNRWTMSAAKVKVDGILSEELQKSESRPSTLWFNSIMVHCIEFAEKASISKIHYKLAVEMLQGVFERLDSLPVEDDIANGEDGSIAEKKSGVDSTIQSVLCSQDKNITLLDPFHTISKGRPRSLRMKGHIEKTKKTCSNCNVKGHTKPTCPAQKKSRYAGNLAETSNREASA